MPSPFEFVLLAIATWQIAHIITKDSGPYNLVGAFRTRFPLGGLTTCLRCCAVWVAIALYAVYLLVTRQPVTGMAVVFVPAISGAALMLASYSGAAHS